MDGKQPTCEERVEKELGERLDELRKLWAAEQQGEEDPDLGPLNEFGLSFDYVSPNTFKGQSRGYFRYQLSWGGPSDEFRIFLDELRCPTQIEYWFLDWFDGAHRKLSGEDEKLLTEIFDWFNEAGIVESELEKAREETTEDTEGEEDEEEESGDDSDDEDE